MVTFSYATWNGYTYNAGNPGSYTYGGSDLSGISNSTALSYPQYSHPESNSQYPYGPSPMVHPNEYYSHYSYGVSRSTSNVYTDPNSLLFEDYFLCNIFIYLSCF